MPAAMATLRITTRILAGSVADIDEGLAILVSINDAVQPLPAPLQAPPRSMATGFEMPERLR